MFRFLRISLLLTLLVIVAAGTWLTKLRATDWNNPLWVVIYPVNGDNDPRTARYIDAINSAKFKTLEQFFADEAQGWEVAIENPITIHIAPPVSELPPKAPVDANILSVMAWSLKMRYWAFKMDTFAGPSPDIKMFVVYHQADTHAALDHSVGLEKGLIGVANVFAGAAHAEKNNVIIAHEILHTLGASDKYGPDTLPNYPEGYAEPSKQPRYPQNYAEIMGGRVPLSESRAVIPQSLHHCVVGPKTAEEINWISAS